MQTCEACIGERESSELMHKLCYSDEVICVHLVRGKEPPKYLIEASTSVSEPDRRASKRSRRTSSGNSVNLRVSGSTSIYQLKMMIWEAFGVCISTFVKLHNLDIFNTSSLIMKRSPIPCWLLMCSLIQVILGTCYITIQL